MDAETAYQVVVGLTALYGAILSTVAFRRSSRRIQLAEARNVAALKELKSTFNRLWIDVSNLAHGYHDSQAPEEQRNRVGGQLVEMIRDRPAMLEDVRSWRIRRATNRTLRSKAVDFFLASGPVTEGEVRNQAGFLLEGLERFLKLTRREI